jgi:hypothetical protein
VEKKWQSDKMDDIYILTYIVIITLVNLWGYYERAGIIQVVAFIFGLFDLALMIGSDNMAPIVAFLILINGIILFWGVTADSKR